MDECSVIRTEKREAHTSLVRTITEYGLGALKKTGYKLFFGVRDDKVKVFRSIDSGTGEADEVGQLSAL